MGIGVMGGLARSFEHGGLPDASGRMVWAGGWPGRPEVALGRAIVGGEWCCDTESDRPCGRACGLCRSPIVGPCGCRRTAFCLQGAGVDLR